MRFPVLLALAFLSAPNAEAAIFTVGPAGSSASLQGGINAANLAAGDDEVRVQAGIYPGLTNVSNVATVNGAVIITGGWNSTFDQRNLDPVVTTLDGQGFGTTFSWLAPFASFTLDGFTVMNGSAPRGGGIRVGPMKSGTTVILSNNLVVANGAENGGGVYVEGWESASIIVTGNTIRQNTITFQGASLRGGGLSVRALDSASFSVDHNLIEDNQSVPDPLGAGAGSGVFLKLQIDATVDFSDNVIRGNQSVGAGITLGDAAAIWVLDWPTADTTATLTAQRNQWLDNVRTTPLGDSQLNVIARDLSTVVFSDSIVAGGSDIGVRMIAQGLSTVRFNNNTVVDHASTGVVETPSTGTASVFNSILFGNSPDLQVSGASTGSNLVGVDPLFTAGSFLLQATSPAIDQGDNLAPGGLGAFDVNGNSRIANGVVDIGATEFVPEPAGLLLQAMALAGVGLCARQRRPLRGATEPGRRWLARPVSLCEFDQPSLPQR